MSISLRCYNMCILFLLYCVFIYSALSRETNTSKENYYNDKVNARKNV